MFEVEKVYVWGILIESDRTVPVCCAFVFQAVVACCTACCVITGFLFLLSVQLLFFFLQVQ